MALSAEVKKLFDKWDAFNGWPKRLEWITINGVRGWSGQRVDFNFPIVAIVGENGSGKSTILQASASVYRSSSGGKEFYPSEFFPDTAWEKQHGVEIGFSVREGNTNRSGSVRKPTGRWRGNPERRERVVTYSDLSRLQPVSTRVGYARIARANATEAEYTDFTSENLKRLSSILGRNYTAAKNSISSMDFTREVTVLSGAGGTYSGFHQGAGEMTVAEVVNWNIPDNSLLLIDEVETSLHPRAQRRYLRDLADMARVKNVQIILTTHSPYILEELPERARIQVANIDGVRTLLTGVSPFFAMTKMDDEIHYEAEVYVEDAAAKALVEEVMAQYLPRRSPTTLVSPCGPSSVGKALGLMKDKRQFSRPTAIFLDSDQDASPGCSILPEEGLPPEPFIFKKISDANFGTLPETLKREYSTIADACGVAMTLDDHHLWVAHVSNSLRVPPAMLWQAMVSEWAKNLITDDERDAVIQPIEELYEG